MGCEPSFFLAKAARGHGRRSDANTAGDHRFFRIVGDRILVDGHVGGAQHGFGFLASDALGAQVDQHHMALGAAADNAQAAFAQGLRHHPGVGQHLLLVEFEGGRQRFLESHCLGSDHMH